MGGGESRHTVPENGVKVTQQWVVGYQENARHGVIFDVLNGRELVGSRNVYEIYSHIELVKSNQR